jgi:hypothetical protein
MAKWKADKLLYLERHHERSFRQLPEELRPKAKPPVINWPPPSPKFWRHDDVVTAEKYFNRGGE